MRRTRSLGDFLDSPYGGSLNLGGNAPGGGLGLDFGGGGLNLGFGQGGFGSGGFDFSSFGGSGASNRYGLDFGYQGLDLGLDLFAKNGGLSKLGGGGGRITLDDVLRVVTTLSPIVAALFGREAQYAASRGAIPATGAAAPPGYTRIQNPATGEALDVPNALVGEYAQRYTDSYNAGVGGGISTTTLLVGAGLVGAFWWANRRKADNR